MEPEGKKIHYIKEEKMIEITTAFLTETMEIRRHGTTPYKH